jgi:MFS transporter, Spinster family, sphingosine-1-phosphate transporter
MKEGAYRRYLLTVLVAVLAFNYVDRLTLGLVLQTIKAELALTDTQLGVLTGIAFAVFYSLMGLPLARWADRGNRVRIISVTVALWSLAVALSGTARDFVELLLFRVVVAIGEAGCMPPAHSLIADHFSRGERPRAVAFYMLGAPLSGLVGYFVAGWLNELYGWRLTFRWLGLPGLLLAVLVALTLRDPRSQAVPAGVGVPREARPEPSYTVAEVAQALWRNHTFRDLVLCFSLIMFFSYGILQWQPAFFIRSYGLSTGELGTWFALIYGLGGLLGTYLGGEWASRWAANNERLQLRTMALVYLGFGIISAMTYLTTNRYVAFGLMGIGAVGGVAANGPLFASIQSLVAPSMRATSVAIIYLFANLIGMGLGPLAAGILSDQMQSWVGQESLRYALLALSPGFAWAAWHLWRASRTVARDLEAAELDLAL